MTYVFFLRGREEGRFFCPSLPGAGVLRGARGRRCTLGGASGIGISPVAVGCPGTSGCGSSPTSSPAGGESSALGRRGHERLRLVDLLVLGGDDFLGLRRRSRRMELGAEEHDEAAFFIDLVADQPLVLRIVQQLAELLETVLARLEIRPVLP